MNLIFSSLGRFISLIVILVCRRRRILSIDQAVANLLVLGIYFLIFLDLSCPSPFASTFWVSVHSAPYSPLPSLTLPLAESCLFPFYLLLSSFLVHAAGSPLLALPTPQV